MTGRLARLLALAATAAAAVLVFGIGGSAAQQAHKAQAAHTVNYRLSEFNIGGPTRLQAGQTTLKFWDAGRFQHNFKSRARRPSGPRRSTRTKPARSPSTSSRARTSRSAPCATAVTWPRAWC